MPLTPATLPKLGGPCGWDDGPGSRPELDEAKRFEEEPAEGSDGRFEDSCERVAATSLSSLSASCRESVWAWEILRRGTGA
jgi:hypothetical protein